MLEGQRYLQWFRLFKHCDSYYKDNKGPGNQKDLEVIFKTMK